MNDSLFHPNDTYFSGLHGALKADRTSGWQLLPAYLKEMGYQVSINLVLLVLFSFNLDETEYLSARTLFTPQKLAFFGNYLAAATNLALQSGLEDFLFSLEGGMGEG